ncbi:hypothetical protein [Humibacter ginsenosidimutans]|uniref:Uncharacterized protein n=1 Tax=Humibacter ginsenosidimutans TaxID=2599293 RepID=A0A5B8M400_9MICO|nr:hypothetical protein [Humibacter ginsenosidimutans]QDZ15016.1 hypothetical protein FPZ11_09770 [Humibacter ginsenosidimutans]
MNDPWWAYAIGVPVALILCIGLPLFFIFTSGRRSNRQSLVIQDGRVTVMDSSFGRGKTFDTSRIDTAVYFPPKQPAMVVAPVTSVPLAATSQDYRDMSARASGNGGSLFRTGGLILLDAKGRMLAHVVYQVGSDAPIEQVWKQLPARRHVQAPFAGDGYSRRDFKKAFPRALHVGQMWSSGRWLALILGLLFIGVPVGTFVVIFIIAIIVTLLGLD